MLLQPHNSREHRPLQAAPGVEPRAACAPCPVPAATAPLQAASERFAELHEDVQSTGYSLIDLEGLISQQRDPSNPAGADAAVAGAAASCRRCHRTGVEMSPVSDVGLWKDLGGAGGAGGAGQLCYVCAAEAELDARQPLESKHGQVVPRGASGFDGWTKGLRRTSDKAALKKMYKAVRPSQLQRVGAQLCGEGGEGDGAEIAMQVDELSEGEGGGEGGEGGASGSDSGSSDEEADAAFGVRLGRPVSKKALQRAWRSEQEHLLSDSVVVRNAKQDGKERGGPLATCTICTTPFFDCVQVYPHPVLKVSLCVYCYEGYMVRNTSASQAQLPRGGGAAHDPEPEPEMCEMGLEMGLGFEPPAVDARAERRPPRRLLLPFAGGPLDEGGGEGGPLDGLHLRALAPRDGVAAAGAAASPLGDLLAQLPSAPAMPPERFRAQVSRCTNYHLRLATISSC